jgi:hypothetical protein
MLIYKMNLLGDFKSVASGTQGWLLGEWNNRVIQLSVFSSIVFYVLSSYKLIDEVEKILTKFLNMKVGKEGTRIVHAVIFGFFMYVATRFILDPVARKLSNGVIEGLAGFECDGLHGVIESMNEVQHCVSDRVGASGASIASVPLLEGGGCGEGFRVENVGIPDALKRALSKALVECQAGKTDDAKNTLIAAELLHDGDLRLPVKNPNSAQKR